MHWKPYMKETPKLDIKYGKTHIWGFSSAGSEQYSYKVKVDGSNPSSPTSNRGCLEYRQVYNCCKSYISKEYF